MIDHRGDQCWCRSCMSDAERLIVVRERLRDALTPFKGKPMDEKTLRSIVSTVARIRRVIDLELAGMRRDWAEAIADGN